MLHNVKDTCLHYRTEAIEKNTRNYKSVSILLVNIERVIKMKVEQNLLEKLAREIIKLFADNEISYAEADEIMYYTKKKMSEQLVKDY